MLSLLEIKSPLQLMCIGNAWMPWDIQPSNHWLQYVIYFSIWHRFLVEYTNCKFANPVHLRLDPTDQSLMELYLHWSCTIIGQNFELSGLFLIVFFSKLSIDTYLSESHLIKIYLQNLIEAFELIISRHC